MRRRLLDAPFATAVLVLTGCLSACGGGSRGTPIESDSDGDRVVDSLDCAAQDATRWQRFDYHGIDNDGDGKFSSEQGSVCIGSSAAKYSAATVPTSDIDCNDADAAVWKTLSFAARDQDGDNRQILAAGQLCATDTLPIGYSAVRNADPVDCDDSDGTRWQILSYAAVDLDNDNRRVASAGQFCTGTSLPAHYFQSVSNASPVDCDDNDSSRWRIAATFADRDGDSVGAGVATNQCIGNNVQLGRSMYGYDPLDDPTDPNARSITESTDLHVIRSIID